MLVNMFITDTVLFMCNFSGDYYVILMMCKAFLPFHVFCLEKFLMCTNVYA